MATVTASRVVAALLAWIAIISTLPRFLRDPSDPRAWAAWRAIVLLALGLTLGVPVVTQAFDGAIELPNAAHWLSDALVLGTAHAVDEFLVALKRGTPGLPARRHWALGLWLGTSALMAVLLWRADLHVEITTLSSAALAGHVPVSLIAYEALFALAFCTVVLHLMWSCIEFVRLGRSFALRAGPALTLIGTGWALAYFAVSMLLLLTPPAYSAMLLGWQRACSVLAAACTTCGTMLPFRWIADLARRIGLQALSRHLATCLSARRLEPLWEALSTAEPDTVLPISLTWRAALLHPEDMDLLLTRRVVEILDARRVLLSEQASLAAQASHGVTEASSTVGHDTTMAPLHPQGAHLVTAHPEADGTETDGQELASAARKEADRLAIALGWAAGDRRVNAAEPYYHPTTFADQVHYLEFVAAHLCRRRRRCTWKPWLKRRHSLASLRHKRHSASQAGHESAELQ